MNASTPIPTTTQTVRTRTVLTLESNYRAGWHSIDRRSSGAASSFRSAAPSVAQPARPQIVGSLPPRSRSLEARPEDEVLRAVRVGHPLVPVGGNRRVLYLRRVAGREDLNVVV